MILAWFRTAVVEMTDIFGIHFKGRFHRLDVS